MKSIALIVTLTGLSLATFPRLAAASTFSNGVQFEAEFDVERCDLVENELTNCQLVERKSKVLTINFTRSSARCPEFGSSTDHRCGSFSVQAVAPDYTLSVWVNAYTLKSDGSDLKFQMIWVSNDNVSQAIKAEIPNVLSTPLAFRGLGRNRVLGVSIQRYIPTLRILRRLP